MACSITSTGWRFNPRPPRGGRLPTDEGAEARSFLFQSTPPARRATSIRNADSSPTTRFQSTPPARRATRRQLGSHPVRCRFNPRPPRGGRPPGRRPKREPDDVSIHAPPRGGRRGCRFRHSFLVRRFNPRPPRGGRRLARATGRMRGMFQSTPPARRATRAGGRRRRSGIVSIHAPRAEGDRSR